MTPTFVLVVIALIAVLIYSLFFYQKKNELRKTQKANDLAIERDLLNKTISELCQHSNHERLTSLIVFRIKELIKYGANPKKVYSLLDRLGIVKIIIGPKSTEEQLQSSLQRCLIETLDSHDMNCWMSSQKPSKEDWQALNGSILANVPKNGFIWEIVLS